MRSILKFSCALAISLLAGSACAAWRNVCPELQPCIGAARNSPSPFGDALAVSYGAFASQHDYARLDNLPIQLLVDRNSTQRPMWGGMYGRAVIPRSDGTILSVTADGARIFRTDGTFVQDVPCFVAEMTWDCVANLGFRYA